MTFGQFRITTVFFASKIWLLAVVAAACVLGWQATQNIWFPVLGGLAVVGTCLSWLAMRGAVWQPLRRIDAAIRQMAEGNLTQSVEPSSSNEISLLYASLKRLQDGLSRSLGSVRIGMESIDSASGRIAAGNSDLSTRTEQQASALQQTAASMEQLSGTVRQNADNARQANQLAATASDVAQQGGKAVGEVVTTMEAISASSRKISDIVGVIDSIAFQTNILALNAAVEAARAGEQGKGFAVVAAEVRALAQRSAQAAKEIKGLIEDSVQKVQEGSGQVERAGATMDEIVAAVARVTDIMGEISAATTEQATGIDQINQAVSQMDRVTQENAALVGQTASAANSLRDQVAQVAQAVAVFKTALPAAARKNASAAAAAPSSPKAAQPQSAPRSVVEAKADTLKSAKAATPRAELDYQPQGAAAADVASALLKRRDAEAIVVKADVGAKKRPDPVRKPGTANGHAVPGMDSTRKPLSHFGQSAEDDWVEF